MAEDGNRWKKIIIGALIVFSVLLVLIGLLVGLRGLADFFKWLLIGLLIISILFGIGYVIYLLFIKKTYKDIPYQFKKKLQEVTKVMKNDMLGNLYLSGDTKHNRISLGKFYYLRMNLPKILNAEGKDSSDRELTSEIVPVDCFIVDQKGVFNKMFSDPIFVLCKPEDHDYSSIFNDVTINGFNLMPLDSQFFTIDKRNLDLDMVKGLALNYIRECVYDIFTDLDRLVQQAMNLDQQFQKDKERSREFEIPQMSNMMGGKNK